MWPRHPRANFENVHLAANGHADLRTVFKSPRSRNINENKIMPPDTVPQNTPKYILTRVLNRITQGNHIIILRSVRLRSQPYYGLRERQTNGRFAVHRVSYNNLKEREAVVTAILRLKREANAWQVRGLRTISESVSWQE
jgi:hypothetical protein